MEVDFSKLDLKTRTRVDDILRRDFDLQVLKAIRRQTLIAKRNELHRPRARDGFGPRTLEVDAFIDAIWRQTYGHDYSDDGDLLKFLQRRNPEICVKSQGTRIQVGYAPSATSSKVRFSKRYEQQQN